MLSSVGVSLSSVFLGGGGVCVGGGRGGAGRLWKECVVLCFQGGVLVPGTLSISRHNRQGDASSVEVR